MKFSILIVFIFSLISCSSNKKLDNEINEDFRKFINRIDNKSLEPEAEDLFIDAMTLQQQEKWAESLIDLNLALERDSSAGIYYAVARAYINLQRYELAVKSMEKSLSLNPDFLPTLEMLVELYMQQDNPKSALLVYEKIIQIDDSKSRLLSYANILETYKPKESVPIYERMLEEDPKNERLILKLLKLYKVLRENEKYLSLLENYQNLKSNNSSVGLDLLDLYLDNKEYNNAVDLLDKIDKNVATSDLNKFYGTVGYRMLYDSLFNDKEVINRYLNKIDSRFYFDWQLQLQAGYLSSKIGNEAKSNELFNKALKVSDTIPDIYVSIGIYYLQSLKDSIALDYFSDGYSKFNDDYRFPFFLGIANQSLEEYNKSISFFRESLSMKEDFLENWIQLGIVYDLVGKADSSDYYYNGALKLDSLNPLVNNNYAYSLSLRGKELNKAEEMSKIALSMVPNNAAYLDTYAWINYLIGKYDVALEYIEKAITVGNASAEVYEHYGDILVKLNNKSEAIKAYKKSLSLEPDRISAKERINKIESK